MKITSIHVDSFGHWKDLELPEVSTSITVIHGPNEAGKSTLLHLIRAILYGFSPRHHARFVPPRYPGPVGGRLEVSGSTGRFAVRRALTDPHNFRADEVGDLSVRSIDGSLQGKHLLGSMLSGVDDAIFRNVFAVGLSEIQQLSTLSDTEAARQLYGLAAGADRVSVADVSRHLDHLRQRQMIGSQDGSITALMKQRQDLASSLELEQRQAEPWLQLFETRRQIDDEIAQLQRRQKRFGEPLSNADCRQQLRSQWKSCQRLHRQLNSFGPVPDISADAVQQLDRLAKQLGMQRKSWEKLRDRRRELRQQARELTGHPTLLHHAESIQALHGRSSWIGDLTNQAERSRAQLDETEFELQGEFERLGLKSNWRAESLPLITDEMISELRTPSHEARDARQQGESAEQAEREGLQAVEKIERLLAARLKADEPIELSQLLKRQEKQIALLQQRLQLQGQLDSANRQQQEAREEYHDWAQRQLLPWRGLMGLGLVFSVGVIVLCMALFAGFFRIDADQRGVLAFVGLLICGLALLIKGSVEFTARRGAARCRDEIVGVRKQIDRMLADIQRMESQFPASHEPFAVQLQEAEDRWQELNELQPLEQQRLDAQCRVDAARDAKARSEQRMEDARQQWRDRLRHFGLPEAMTPSQFRKLAQTDSKIGMLRRRLLELHQKLEAQRTEVKDVQDRLQLLFERIGQAPDSDRLDEQIEQIHRLMQDARQTQQQRDALRRKWRDLGREQHDVARAAHRLQAKRQQLVVRHGVGDVHELKATVKRRQQAAKLRRQRDETLTEIAGQLGSVCSLAQLRKDLDGGDFEKRLGKWEREHDESSGRLASLLERRGEVGQQIKSLASQRLTLNKRLQIQEVQAELDQQFQHWQSLAGIGAVLNSVRQTYESDRQPETLAEASAYLKQMTQARYERVWTPFGESSLCVDDRQGKPVRVEHLSRGTREQVFLSLRLALCAAYGRRGASLPLILDDVFVNFDARRAQCAAETVVQFAAAGHQVLVFTCHEHIRDVFWKLGVDLRELPSAEQHARSPQPVLSSQPVVEHAEPEPKSVPVAIATPLPPGLPTEGDPELDYELLYGAPEYDPGYRAKVPTDPVAHRPVKRRRRRRRRPLDPPASDPPWGQVAEYVEWVPAMGAPLSPSPVREERQ